MNTKIECFSYKMDVVCVGVVRVQRHLKAELAWATIKQIWVISNIVLLKTVIPLRK